MCTYTDGFCGCARAGPYISLFISLLGNQFGSFRWSAPRHTMLSVEWTSAKAGRERLTYCLEAMVTKALQTRASLASIKDLVTFTNCFFPIGSLEPEAIEKSIRLSGANIRERKVINLYMNLLLNA